MALLFSNYSEIPSNSIYKNLSLVTIRHPSWLRLWWTASSTCGWMHNLMWVFFASSWRQKRKRADSQAMEMQEHSRERGDTYTAWWRWWVDACKDAPLMCHRKQCKVGNGDPRGGGGDVTWAELVGRYRQLEWEGYFYRELFFVVVLRFFFVFFFFFPVLVAKFILMRKQTKTKKEEDPGGHHEQALALLLVSVMAKS